MLAIIILATTFGTALARPAGEVAPGTCPHSLTVRVGKGGFHSTNADFPCQTEAYQVRAQAAPVPKTLKFIRPVLRLEQKTVQPRGVVFSGKATVFFDLNKNQEKAWNQGVLAIYYYNLSTRSWQKLSSSRVEVKGKIFRISSSIWDYGYYGLAKVK